MLPAVFLWMMSRGPIYGNCLWSWVCPFLLRCHGDLEGLLRIAQAAPPSLQSALCEVDFEQRLISGGPLQWRQPACYNLGVGLDEGTSRSAPSSEYSSGAVVFPLPTNPTRVNQSFHSTCPCSL